MMKQNGSAGGGTKENRKGKRGTKDGLSYSKKPRKERNIFPDKKHDTHEGGARCRKGREKVKEMKLFLGKKVASLRGNLHASIRFS